MDSTNNYAMGLVHAGMAQHGTAVFTSSQTKGRGQRGKDWLSGSGANIALSIIIEPSFLAPSEMFLLSMAVANGVLHFFNKYAPADCTIKWPNDLYWQDRKAGGILIENVWQGGEWNYAIAGIGLNVNQTEFPGLETKAVSLLQITGKKYEPAALARELCQHLDEAVNELKHDKTKTIATYQNSLYKRHEWVRLKKEAGCLMR